MTERQISMYYRICGLCEDAIAIRREVFVEEQGFSNEFDGRDAAASHIVFYEKETPAAVCRFFPSEEPDVFTAGRIAVRRRFRGRGLGNFLMKVLEEAIRQRGGRKIVLSAQTQAVPFYQSNGYRCFGEPYLDEFCPHIGMEKVLDGQIGQGTLTSEDTFQSES